MSTKRTAFITIHGPAGTGKTTLANTAPGPRLIIDGEAGSEDVDVPILYWDGPGTPMPDGITPKHTVVLDSPDWSTLVQTVDYLVAGDHPFKSVVIDSITEMQKQLKDKIRPDYGIGEEYERASYDVWDQLLTHMESQVRRLRDLTRRSAAKPVNVIVVALTNNESTPHKPLLQGSLRKSMPGFVHLQGYLGVVIDAEGNQRRRLQIQPTSDGVAEVKCRLRLVGEQHGDYIWDPHLARDVLRVINPTTNKEKS